MAIFNFLDEIYRPSTQTQLILKVSFCSFIWVTIFLDGKVPKAYIPLLEAAAQAAKKEAPISPLVSQAVAAANLWLSAACQSGRAPDTLWTVLADLKVTNEDHDTLPLWLKDRFLLNASKEGTRIRFSRAYQPIFSF